MSDPLTLSLTCNDQTYAVVGLRGEESISSLYRFELDIICEAGTTLPDEIAAGADVTLTFSRRDDTVRLVHGLISTRRKRVDNESTDPRYRLVLVPHLHRANLVQTQRIFLGVSVVDIIRNKLELIGLEGELVSLANLGDYPVRDFVMQYHETDYSFISRLCEHVGISFFFEQLNASDQLVFADGPNDFGASSQSPSIQLTDSLNQPERIYALELDEPMTPGNYVAYDYNYRRPDLQLVGSQEVAGGHGGGLLEYACHVKDEIQAQDLAAIRAEELACRTRQYRGESSIVGLTAGGVTTLEASAAFEETELLITKVRHEAVLSEDGEERLTYRNRFEAVETTITYRPQRRTPRPQMAGFVTGTVLGPNGATDTVSPHLDDKGRYTIRFHLDTVLGDPTLGGSHLVRMAQPFGGTGHGMHFPLRPGTEVMMVFANGDPDRPVIVGAVPNEHTRTPVTATNATQNRITAASGAIFEISERR